jgi:hypothetical protein
MSHWADLASWRGTPNHGAAAVEQRGIVLHIAQGTFDGTIAWCQNPKSYVSAHFVVGKVGQCVQLVDTDVTAWSQRAGNGRWLSIEFEGYSGETLTAAQLTVAAEILARAHRIYGVPLQLANSPLGEGLGWHGMGGKAWGNHPDCPGAPIVAQRGRIIELATGIINEGTTMQLTGPDPWGKAEDVNQQAAELRNAHAALMHGYQDSTATPDGVVARLQRIEDDLGRITAEPTDYRALARALLDEIAERTS